MSFFFFLVTDIFLFRLHIGNGDQKKRPLYTSTVGPQLVSTTTSLFSSLNTPRKMLLSLSCSTDNSKVSHFGLKGLETTVTYTEMVGSDEQRKSILDTLSSSVPDLEEVLRDVLLTRRSNPFYLLPSSVRERKKSTL